MDRHIQFVAKHYRRGAFETEHAWRRLGIIAAHPIWRRVRVAASVACAIALTATAMIAYRHFAMPAQPEPVEISTCENALQAVRVIDFENAPLTSVVAEIQAVYGVKVTNVPDNAADYRLSLHYEGNPADLIGVINDILDTQMTVSQ